MCGIRFSLLFAIFLLAAPSVAEEQQNIHPYLGSKFSLDVGVFFPERQVALSVDGPSFAQGEEIDFRQKFGLAAREDLFALNFHWSFGEKWSLGAQFFEADGQRQKVLLEDVQWGDYVFGTGTGVAAGTDFSLARVFFNRSLSSSDRHDFAIGIGLHSLELGAFIEGNAFVDGEQVGFRRESVSARGPLPNIGARYLRSLSDRWALQARLDWLSANVGDYDGRLINASLGVNYRLHEHVGFGLSYNFFELDVGVNEDGWRGEFETIYDGLFAHISAYW
jgi:hypothetical protein